MIAAGIELITVRLDLVAARLIVARDTLDLTVGTRGSIASS
jgi:hypothetical protein